MSHSAAAAVAAGGGLGGGGGHDDEDSGGGDRELELLRLQLRASRPPNPALSLSSWSYLCSKSAAASTYPRRRRHQVQTTPGLFRLSREREYSTTRNELSS